MKTRNMDIKFRGIDSWNRPVYKVVDKKSILDRLISFSAMTQQPQK